MDVTEAVAIIHSQFPEVSLSDVTFLGEGCDSWAFEIGQRSLAKQDPDRSCVPSSFQISLVFEYLPLLLNCHQDRSTGCILRQTGGQNSRITSSAEEVSIMARSLFLW